MDLLFCLWLLALLTRLDGRDVCGLCAKVAKPALRTAAHGGAPARNRL